MLCLCKVLYTSVTAAGFGALLPGTTLGRTVFDTGTGRAGHNDDSVRDGVRILIYQVGGHALASLEGGGPCPLGTHYLLSFSALGLPINLNTLRKGYGVRTVAVQSVTVRLDTATQSDTA